MNQEFGVDDIAMLDDEFKVRVNNVFEEEDGSYYYEVEPIEFKSFPREVEQSRLAHI